jgi:hypothetical protein
MVAVTLAARSKTFGEHFHFQKQFSSTFSFTVNKLQGWDVGAASE